MDEHVERAARHLAKVRTALAVAEQDFEKVVSAALREKRITDKELRALQRAPRK